jgi:hypothetical protein
MDRIDEIKKSFNLRDAFITLISNGTNLYFVFFLFSSEEHRTNEL